MKIKNLTPLLVAFVLSSCGFQPVHSEKRNNVLRGEVPLVKMDINIDGMPVSTSTTEIKHLLDRAIQESFYPNGSPKNNKEKYILKGNFSLQQAAFGIQQDSRITRYNIYARINYTLENVSGDIKIPNNIFRTGSYDATSASQYATFSAERDAQSRIVQELSRDLLFKVLGDVKKIRSGEIKPIKKSSKKDIENSGKSREMDF